jgi:ribosomal protein S18 acetylase RimI-like enzyme
VNAGEVIALRTADARDLGAVSALFLATWERAYRGILPGRVVDLFDKARAQELWQGALGRDDRTAVVAEAPDGTIVGLVVSGRDPERTGSGHIFSLYVHPRAQGQGVGTRLLAHALGALAADGLTAATLWVFEANHSSRAFYARAGWTANGRRRVEPEFGEPEVQLERSIGEAT